VRVEFARFDAVRLEAHARRVQCCEAEEGGARRAVAAANARRLIRGAAT
jgi:hypothetical protein